jgi:putative restriction endonuclease
MRNSKAWVREELFIVLNLYHKLNFGRFHARNPVIIEVAKRMGRTPGSVAMKLCNLASLDPVIKLQGKQGLPASSRLDRDMWDEFHANLPETGPESEEAFRRLLSIEENDEISVLPEGRIQVLKKPPVGSTETLTTVKLRRGQDYFRNVVLNNFEGCCGITGLNIRQLLIASHIMPWGTHPMHRLNVRNGLCLSRLHDAAFDQGLITFDEELRLELSAGIKRALDNQAVHASFEIYEGKALRLPDDAVAPDPKFLEYHRTRIFLKSAS